MGQISRPQTSSSRSHCVGTTVYSRNYICNGSWILEFFIQAGRRQRRLSAPEERWGLVLAVLAALSVAIYTLWDRVAISHMHPFIYMYCYNTTTVLFFAPSLKKLKKETIANEWKKTAGVSYTARIMD